MSDRHEDVTPNVTGDSRHPVPTRPDPTRPALYRSAGETEHHVVQVGDARESEPTGSTEPNDSADAMMLQSLDFHPTCGTNACKAAPNPAAYAVRWVRHLQPSLGRDVTLLCDPCWRAGVTVMSQCEAGVLWRIVEVLR